MSSEIVFVLFCIEECSSYMLVRNKVYVVLITGLEYYKGRCLRFCAHKDLASCNACFKRQAAHATFKIDAIN